jgi:multisubunit Na+/H+ antiporter MnhB subunit
MTGIDILGVAVSLCVLAVVVVLSMYVTDWILSKFAPTDARARLLATLVAVLVGLLLLAIILGFLPYIGVHLWR